MQLLLRALYRSQHITYLSFEKEVEHTNDTTSLHRGFPLTIFDTPGEYDVRYIPLLFEMDCCFSGGPRDWAMAFQSMWTETDMDQWGR